MHEPNIDESPIALLCDRCGAEGLAGGAGFEDLGDLLNFAPVPRQNKRQDGWTAALQRRFIAHLARSGSPTLAAEALGKNRHGVEKLYKAKDADGFRRAWDRAVAYAEDSAALRIEEENAAARELKAPAIDMRRKPGSAERDADAGDEWDQPAGGEQEVALPLQLEVIERLGMKFFAKVQAERDARLAGQVVAADFYLRQITALEVAFDLMAQECGYSGFDMLTRCRRGDFNLYAIAETPFSRMLDDERRKMWAGEDEPERPEHPPERYLEHRVDPVSGEGYSLEPTEALGPASRPPVGADPEEWAAMGYEEQKLVFARLHEEEAARQIEWESRATAEHNSRSRSDK